MAFIAEELVDGQPITGFQRRTWREKWREGFFPTTELATAMRDVALGLTPLHQHDLVHGRLSHESIVVDANNTIRLVGLGSESTQGNKDLTPQSPNLPSNRFAADLYQLGETFFYIATGQQFSPDHDSGTAEMRLKRLNRQLSRSFCRIVARCLDKSPGGSYSSAQEVVDDLNAVISQRVIRSRWRPRVYSLGIEIICLFIVLAFLSNMFLSSVVGVF